MMTMMTTDVDDDDDDVDDYDGDDDDDDDDCLITQPRPRSHRAREQELWQHCTVQMPGVNSVPIVRANFGHPLEVEAY